MTRHIRLVATLLFMVVASENLSFALGSKNAAYFGGTITIFGNPKDPVEGQLDTAKESALVFTPQDKKLSGNTHSIPYAKVVDLEYGQKAGRRVGAAIGTTILLGPLGLPYTPFNNSTLHVPATMRVVRRSTKASGHVAEIKERSVTYFRAAEFLLFVDGAMIESQLFHGQRLGLYANELKALVEQLRGRGWVEGPAEGDTTQ